MRKLRHFRFTAISAKQGRHGRVFTFPAYASEILSICEITRAGRDKKGHLFGFQRSQIASHIHEIEDYLATPSAILPNSIVVGFMRGVKTKKGKNDVYTLTVSVGEDKPGFVIDGQQRLTALEQTGREDFEVLVSCIICEDAEELRQQFILINNTRPLPKSLIYELLPDVPDLPKRLDGRAFASELTDRLNFDQDSTLKGQIHTHTNPEGVLRDTAVQKVIMNSAENGAVREHSNGRSRGAFAFELVSNYFGAVQDVFPEAWVGHTPHTSRLVHGAGIVSMGYVMETLYSQSNAMSRKAFARGLVPLRKRTAWTSGIWVFPDGGRVKWDDLENTSKQIHRLSLHLVGVVKRSRSARKAARKRA